MNLPEHLTPVSYHLRHFNKYDTLDLPASENGNLTIIGENAVGKTTLANCFFPMLIDGAISTPSFNAAKGTENVSQNATARNSARDTRTFASMLLGWGSGAMKVRTGYTYMVLRSVHRQVILGLGAHRADGDTRQPTWWFAVVSDDPAAPVPLTTTDAAGQCLSKTDFIQANAALGDTFHLFDTALDYREYIAVHIYGFASGETLGKLANVYRLLASPILTSGNAKFSPIRNALKNAQEGIDDQVIQSVANSQREVNQYNGLLDRIKTGQTRLTRMKETIFWGNLNHLQELILSRYSEAHGDYEKEKEKRAQAEIQARQYTDQLQLLAENLAASEQELAKLRDAQAEQKTIIERRHQYADQITLEKKRLKDYRARLDQLATLHTQQTDIQAQLAAVQADQAALQKEQLSPLQTTISTHAAQLQELAKAIAQTELAAVVQHMAAYLRHLKTQRNQYQHLTETMAHLNQDVAIVHTMQDAMGTSIDRHVTGPLTSRSRTALHQDNEAIHEHGAAQMSDQFQALKDQQQQLLAAHPDLKVILTHPALVDQLTTAQKALAGLADQFAKLTRQQATLTDHAQSKAQEIQTVQQTLDPNFDEAAVVQTITEAQANLDRLIVDAELDKKLATAEQAHRKLTDAEHNATRQKSIAEGHAQSAAAAAQEQAAELHRLAERIIPSLHTLAPYAPEGVTLKTIEDTIAFVTENRVPVRTNSYAQVTSQISKLIHRNDRNGIDRNALDVLFEERNHPDIASAMRQQRSTEDNGLTVVAFDINAALAILATDRAGVEKSLAQRKEGNNFAQTAYLGAAVQRITAQYQAIADYNAMLTQGAGQNNSIRLRITLTPDTVTPAVIAEARDPQQDERPHLLAEIQKRLEKLANDAAVSDDEAAFQAAARDLLDTRQWSNFNVEIHRRQSAPDDYEVVDDKFVQSGGSGAEKAQAMVLPLLLVPKMVLRQAQQDDAPYLVMFDEFADKLDPETAKSFVNTIARFGFCFIATMPNGAQNKVLADGVDNIAYTVLAPSQQDDGQFHKNRVVPALIWRQEPRQ
ncbi:chromosome partitioning protein ParA [Schleiferilactobacillus harbinensis]|uniref:Chromosome segregation ATPase n=1 Tax=Schleiferilactobacillus harbinensis DSM 16991 TaxID=1122147 RepID=A0A0R1XB68_9LACO|nr:SbcC/MukB-like Walker B domain-containing protein [Schleiferilactobacillus harbinensis]KRM27184.1 chromosome segregation ATPase [Schleiferilactobacillus harbinensis DSM 16991]QFR63823.1 chromosome partitioning protein ParA [Schleiferilactobacillus harbinensis]